KLLPRQLVCQFAGVVHLAERLDDGLRVDRYRPRLLIGVSEIEHQRLEVAVKDQADDLGFLVDDRATRIAADDVRRANEIERRLQVELAFALDPALRQVERLLVVVLGGPLIEAGEHRLEGDWLAVLLEALDGAERQP